jgi:hypothetical protein
LSMRHSSPAAVHIERLDPGLVPIYRAMTSAQRVAAGLSATDLIRDRLRATIREAHPEWTDEAVAEAVSRRMLGAGD